MRKRRKNFWQNKIAARKKFSRQILNSAGQSNSNRLLYRFCNFYIRTKNLQKKIGRGSWTRTNACGIQNPVPYQLGDAPTFLSTSGILSRKKKFVNLLFEIIKKFERDVIR